MGRPPEIPQRSNKDVSDNYVMLLRTDDAEYKENEKIIDGIWGSFTMRSGGASGAS
jgi:hypothetical protein